MTTFLRFISIYFPASVIRKITTFVIIIGLGFLLQDFLILFFITFLFAYIFLEIGESLSHSIHDWGSHGKKDTPHKIAEKYATTNTIVTILYVIFVLILIFIFVNILPKISIEIGEFIRRGSDITRSAQDMVSRLEASFDMKLGLDRIVLDIMNAGNIEAFGQTMIGHIKNAGLILMKFFLALILSYVFILERKQIAAFLKKIQKGNFSFFYNEGSIIAKKVGKGFGLIFRAQGLIAVINTLLTSAGLLSIGFLIGGGPFPYIVTLALTVFIFGFIPVFGTFLSGIPIVILGYGLGGWPILVACVLMIMIVHMIEAYYLNPKIVSAYVHFPVFITFIILLLAEHYLGLMGLLIGIPMATILIDLTEDIDSYIDDVKTRLHG